MKLAVRGMVGSGGVRQASMEGTILRCTCGAPEGHVGKVCPQAVAEPVGTLAFHHEDWRVRFAHWILERSGFRFQLWVYGRK